MIEKSAENHKMQNQKNPNNNYAPSMPFHMSKNSRFDRLARRMNDYRQHHINCGHQFDEMMSLQKRFHEIKAQKSVASSLSSSVNLVREILFNFYLTVNYISWASEIPSTFWAYWSEQSCRRQVLVQLHFSQFICGISECLCDFIFFFLFTGTTRFDWIIGCYRK